MPSDAPRIPPADVNELPEDLQKILAFEPEGMGTPLSANNVFTTFAQYPDLFRSWLPFAGRLLGGSTLPEREREILILRAGANSGSSYEWGQHVRIARHIGMDEDEIQRILDGPDAEGWSEHDAALLRAVDELEADSVISDATWEVLSRTYSRDQMMEATMLIGHYKLVAYCLNSFGVELDEGLDPLPGRDG